MRRRRCSTWRVGSIPGTDIGVGAPRNGPFDPSAESSGKSSEAASGVRLGERRRGDDSENAWQDGALGYPPRDDRSLSFSRSVLGSSIETRLASLTEPDVACEAPRGSDSAIGDDAPPSFGFSQTEVLSCCSSTSSTMLPGAMKRITNNSKYPKMNAPNPAIAPPTAMSSIPRPLQRPRAASCAEDGDGNITGFASLQLRIVPGWRSGLGQS